MRLSQEEPISDVHGWRETRPMNSSDVALRAAGYKIVSRPRRGPVLWIRDGKIVTEGTARLRMQQEAQGKSK